MQSVENVSLGVMEMGALQIRAFGPHSSLLDDPKGFGVYRVGTETGWFCCLAHPETWVESQIAAAEEKISLHFRILGAVLPFYFVFYIQAPSAAMGSLLFKPQTLQRYEGEAMTTFFAGIELMTESVQRMKLIPLARQACFWDADFLLAYEVPASDCRIGFEIRKNLAEKN
ncbi:MAG: hypothetical protein HY069_01765 [Chlamydiia bacterium]|nr:hypothetical protein [Chlamydiia bacterium]